MNKTLLFATAILPLALAACTGSVSEETTPEWSASSGSELSSEDTMTGTGSTLMDDSSSGSGLYDDATDNAMD